MMTCEYEGEPFSEPRSHPWIDSADNPAWRYQDLTLSPDLIRSALEDFRPWRRYAFVETFYRLLTVLNHPSSALESNDCAFSGPHANENPAFQKSLQCSGRLMILFRDLQRNTMPGEIEQLAFQLHRKLAVLDVGLKWGVIGTTLVPVRYLALSESSGSQLGKQLMISFWAWGNAEAENMRFLKRLLGNLAEVLVGLSACR